MCHRLEILVIVQVYIIFKCYLPPIFLFHRRQDEIVSPALLEHTMKGNADKLYCLLEPGDSVDIQVCRIGAVFQLANITEYVGKNKHNYIIKFLFCVVFFCFPYLVFVSGLLYFDFH